MGQHDEHEHEEQVSDAEDRAAFEAEQLELDRVLHLAGMVYPAVVSSGRGSVAVEESVRIARAILVEAQKPPPAPAASLAPVPTMGRGHQHVPVPTVAPIQPTPVTHGAQPPQNGVPFPKPGIKPASNPSNFTPRTA
jgi:hypothetical protein